MIPKQTRIMVAAFIAVAAWGSPVRAESGGEPSTINLAPAAHLALDLNRGICIDRQFRAIPPEPGMRFTREDIQLIKAMGFEFVKVLVNPEPLMLDGHLDEAKTGYVREMVDLAAAEQLPVVVCIHPEWEFKKSILDDPAKFAEFLTFLEDTAHFLAGHWGPKQLALQLMTEPVVEKANWNDLQPRMWETARRAMPEHTLILAGDQVGKIDGLITTKPVNDANVMYSFTFYDPFVLTLQGGEWLTPKLWSFLGTIPYPSSPEIIAERKAAILERIPAEPADWRAAADGMLTEYGNARWNKDKLAAYVGKLAAWNASRGGGLKIWCAEFGCYQRTIDPEDRRRFIRDLRETFEANHIGWAYWSYNETFTIMTPDSPPFGPAKNATPDMKMLDALFGTRLSNSK
ncbi:MAG: cellulase family glycosylhydrolase [Candidatus Hydrogenedentes bacterium]|nr:cellulase family glycosylhydrolase [Candidatus Hydrogenedentota bacterium]